MDEQEIIQHLLTLPKTTREHLVAAHEDAAALIAQIIETASAQETVEAMTRQQSMYVRIAEALRDSLTDDTPVDA